MKLRHWITAIVLLLLMAAAIFGLLRTRSEKPPAETAEDDTGNAAPKPHLVLGKPAAQRPLVDQRPLLTARRMTAMASTPEEQALAHQAEKIGDHEVDLAFFDAMRTAQENPPALSAEAKQLAERKSKAEQALRDDQETITQLTRKLATAPDSQKDNLQDQIDVAQAQKDLDQDELDDAAEDLEQAGGDPQSKIKRLKAQHDASDQSAAQAASTANPYEQEYRAHVMLTVFRAWKALREKRATLEDARQEAEAKALRLNQRHITLAAKVEREKESRESAKQQAKGFAKAAGKTSSREDSKASAQSALESLKQYSRDQKNLADLGRRQQDEEELTEIYASWIGLVEVRERAALHNLIEGILWILLVVLVVYLAHRLIDRLFGGVAVENKRVEMLRAVVKFGAQVLGVIVILFLIFGMPSETTTILGLAGAGLTVAGKDVIMAFFGWFLGDVKLLV